jgi:DNA-binding CsgD family transcriptional regulator
VTAEAEGRLPDALASLEAAVRTSLGITPEERPDDPAVWTSCAGSEPDVVANLGNTATHLGHDVVARDCFARVLGRGGTRVRSPWCCTRYLAWRSRNCCSGVGRAEARRARGGRLATSVNQPALAAVPLAWLALLAAVQGDPAYEHRRNMPPRSAASAWAFSRAVLRPAALGGRATAAHAGDHSGALHHYAAMRVPALRRMTVVERIAAAQRAGDHAHAQRELDEHAAYAAASRLPWALAATEHARALLAPAAGRGEALRTGARPPSGQRSDRRPCPDTARVREVLRRGQRRTDARMHLRAAVATFEDLGAEPLAARARTELRASGETPRKRNPSTLAALTPMEAQVARLVAQGLSNKDVGAQLWISPRTVGFHLRGVFAKLAISSRGELAQLPLS